MISPPDWQLPPGVSRGLWEYQHDPEIARNYDAALAGSSLFALDQAFALRHFQSPGRLIDLGCGTGRLLLPFARRGYWVLGVDLSEEMLREAGRKAAKQGVPIERVKANLVELDAIADQSFDYAACLFSTLGMIHGARERERVVQHAYRLLRPGGTLVLHVHNRWFNVWDPAGRVWVLSDLLHALLYRTPGGDKAMPAHQGISVWTLHVFTRSETKRLLRRAGFEIRELLPVGLRTDGRVPFPRWFGRLRAYGYLIAATRPHA
jgi:ubiquinone/menaquinone biosynthesis C-methylase UbiE